MQPSLSHSISTSSSVAAVVGDGFPAGPVGATEGQPSAHTHNSQQPPPPQQQQQQQQQGESWVFPYLRPAIMPTPASSSSSPSSVAASLFSFSAPRAFSAPLSAALNNNNNNASNNNNTTPVVTGGDRERETERKKETEDGERVPLVRSILNVENKPSPPDVPEFLRDPTRFHPSTEFINSIFQEETVLTQAIKMQNLPAVEVLLQSGANPNAQNPKAVGPISVAAHKGNVAILSLLIRYGAEVNAINGSGSTALIQAAHFGHLDAVQLLLAHNTNADFANQKGTTALMRASQEGHVEIARALIGSSVDVNKRNHEGMNALMLASQRGHAEIALLLIKSNAAMDEQTGQGSTALMLASKRGHERCVDVLVTMGAEIYLRDRRMRTARDTAMKRNHLHLLSLLDTQAQVRKIQEIKHRQRSVLIAQLRKAFLQRRLRLSDAAKQVHDLVEAVRISTNAQYAQSVTDTERTQAQCVIDDFSRNGANTTTTTNAMPLLTKDPQMVIAQITNSLSSEHYECILKRVPQFEFSTVEPGKRVTDCADWHWISVFYRCLSLPDGVFELVMEMLPLPRIWHWSLDRLGRRCKLAPQQAMRDMSVIMDEILADARVVAGPSQSNLLLQISRAPQLLPLLTDHLELSPDALETIYQWADVQSILQRCEESEFIFKHQFARRMLSATVSLYRWHRERHNAQKVLKLFPALEDTVTSQRTSTGSGTGGSAANRLTVDADDVMDATDAGGEEASDIEQEIALAEQQHAYDMAPGEGPEMDSDDDSVAHVPPPPPPPPQQVFFIDR